MGVSVSEDRARRPRPPADPRLSQSLESGVALIERFTATRPALGIAELADMLDASRSTTHRYASTLVVLAYLEQDERRRYRLSSHAARVGMAAIDTIRLETPAALTVLEDLREQTGHTVSMGVLDGDRAIYTHRLFAHGQGQYETDLGLRVGAHVPLHCTALGKALLASLAEPEQHEILTRVTLKREGPNTIRTKKALARQLARVRADGLAVCDEEQAPGVRSIAAAITSPGRARPMAVSVTVPARHCTVKQMTAMFGPHVKAAAERI